MPIMFHDETTNTDILYIADDGSIGLNCAAVGGVAVSIGGASWITTDGRFPAGSCVPDSANPLIGEVTLDPGATATVDVSANQEPIASSDDRATAISPSQITLTNTAGVRRPISYSIW